MLVAVRPHPTRAIELPSSALQPSNNLVPRDMEALAEELAAYQALFAPLCRRAEQPRQAAHYLTGQLLDLECKSIERLAMTVPGGNVEALQ